jgi:hypothetical protein
MAGRIDNFWSQLNDEGIAKNSHWDAQINTPRSLLGKGFDGIERTLAFRCEAGELPGRQLVTSDAKVYGPIYKTAYQSLYTELNLTFLETADMRVRRFMEAWMNTIFDSETNILQYQNTYETSMVLTQYDLEAREEVPKPRPEPGDFSTVNASNVSSAASGVRPTLMMFINRAYPVNINQMTTAWSDDSPHRVQVTFFYEWYSLSSFPRTTIGRSPSVPGVTIA